MKIYVHGLEFPSVLSHIWPGTVECKYFKNICEINANKDICFSAKQYIFCVDDEQIRNDLNELYFNSILLINSHFLVDILKKYEKFFSKPTFNNLLHNAVVLFTGFSNQELLTELQFKVIAMGGMIATDFHNESIIVTHIIPYRMMGQKLKNIINDYFFNNMYTSDWVDYYWKSLANHSHDKLDNKYLIEAFKPKYFFNCKIIFVGFDDEAVNGMVRITVSNGGSVYQLEYVDLLDCIVVPDDFLSKDARAKFESIPQEYHEKLVSYSWWLESEKGEFLANFENHAIKGTIGYVACHELQPAFNSTNQSESFSHSVIDNSYGSFSGFLNESEKECLKPISNHNIDIQSCIDNDQDLIHLGYNPFDLSAEKVQQKDHLKML